MNFFKRDLDTMMKTIEVLQKRSRKPLTEEEQELIDKCNQIYERAMTDYRKGLEYRKEYRKKKIEADPLYSRSKAYKDRYAELHPEETESPQ